MVVTVDVTAHKAIEVRECLLHGGVKTGSFPENIKVTVQYGKNLRVMVVADVLPHARGIIVHDCWGSYWKIRM